MNLRLILALLSAIGIVACAADSSPDSAPRFKKASIPLDLTSAQQTQSDFLEGPGRLMTIAQCTGCHSGALVRQYRSTRHGWQNLIRWMQKKQGLWALDPAIEDQILDYLSTRYGRSTNADDRRRPAIAQHLMPPLYVDVDVDANVEVHVDAGEIPDDPGISEDPEQKLQERQ